MTNTIVLPRELLTDEELEMLKDKPGQVIIATEEDFEKRIKARNKIEAKKYIAEIKGKSWSEKMDWYATQNSQQIVFLGNNAYFLRYWKWHVLIPMKIMRFAYKLKNWQFRKHKHISEMSFGTISKRIKPHSI